MSMHSTHLERFSPFIKNLKKEADHEEDSYREYMILASEAERLGLTKTAANLKSIAQDELSHRKKLLTMAELIEAKAKSEDVKVKARK